MTESEVPDATAEYGPFAHVPDRIDQITASGLEQLHDALNEDNRMKLHSIPVKQQGALLWSLVEQGTIDLVARHSSRSVSVSSQTFWNRRLSTTNSSRRAGSCVVVEIVVFSEIRGVAD